MSGRSRASKWIAKDRLDYGDAICVEMICLKWKYNLQQADFVVDRADKRY